MDHLQLLEDVVVVQAGVEAQLLLELELLAMTPRLNRPSAQDALLVCAGGGHR